MDGNLSFGYWLRRRRKALDLTQAELAQRAGCSADLIQKIEADARRPSRQLAERLAEVLDVPAAERTSVIKAARAELAADRLAPPAQGVVQGAFVSSAALPQGTVTFLFTDIEGSTQLWEQHPQAMRDALAHHDTILRQAIEGHSGVIFKTAGDGVCAAFASALDALTAALAAQRTLHTAAWGRSGPLRVRMALHTGVAEADAGDYSGPPLNRVARLLAVGHGSQVLLSGATQELVRDGLPPDVALRDLGIHRLRSLTRPEHIFQLLAPDLPADFPRLKTLDRRHTHLPAQPTPLVGRQEEIAEVVSLLTHPDCRALTIVGPGGVGKTRLALQVAHGLADTFLHGVSFVPLAGLESVGRLPTALAQALDFPFYGTTDPKAQLLDYLRRKELLLILDSLEHLQAGASLVVEVLQHAPQVKILITSRARLNLSWEWTYELGGLAIPDDQPLEHLERSSAVQLFLQRARQVQRQFTLAPADGLAISRICRLVEGLPLALELAATWVRVSSCQEIATEIERGLDFLATSSPDVPARHQSIRAVFEHSWQLLAPHEQDGLRKVSIFRGGFSRAAAEHVAGVSLAVLAGLVDTSMVRHHPSGRYDMHDLLRQYAEEKRNERPQETAMLLEQHGSYYSAFLQERAQRLQGGDQKTALAEIDQEIENVRTAWRWMVDQARIADLVGCLDGIFLFYDLRSWAKEGEAIFRMAVERLTATAQTADRDLLLARLMARQARFCSQLSDYDTARQLLQQNLPVFQRVGDHAEHAFALNQLGEIEWHLGAYDAAKQAFHECLALYQALSHHHGMATAQSNLGMVIHNQGEYQAAQHWYADSLTMFRALGDRWGEATVLHRLGLVAYELGNYQEAEQRYRESLTIKRDLGDLWGVANSLNNLGIVFYDLGEYGTANQCYHESLAIRRELGDRWGMAAALNNLGLIASTQQAYAEAQQRYQESLAMCQEIGDQRGIAIALNNVGEIAFRLGAYAEAKQYHEESLVIFREIGQTRGVTFALGHLGDVSCAVGEYEAAKVYYGQVLKLALDTQAAPRALDALAGLADLLVREGKRERAVELLALVLGHPASEKPTQEKAQRQMAELASQLPAAVVVSAQERGKARDLTTVAEVFLAEQSNNVLS